MRQPVSRRSFLLASAGLVAGVAAACGGGGGEEDDVNVSRKDTETTKPSEFSLVVASYIHTVGVDERVAMAFVKPDGPYKAQGDVTFTIDGKPVEAQRYDEGISLPYYRIRQRFDTAGVKMVAASVAGRTLEAALTVVEQSAVKLPLPGQPMKRVKSPTVADPMGVNPICTKKPACPLHEVSLDAALDEKRPLAVLYATPALCQSQLCGPVLENLLAAQGEFGSKVRMLHIEIFNDLTGRALAPPTKETGLESEPFLFLVGADGVVRERLDNAYDRREVREALGRLTA